MSDRKSGQHYSKRGYEGNEEFQIGKPAENGGPGLIAFWLLLGFYPGFIPFCLYGGRKPMA